MGNALIGMRLPMSFDYEDAKKKVDSVFYENGSLMTVGESDLKVMKNLVKADLTDKTGSPNSKFLRMIHCQICITAPIYWWKEMDTYKIGTVRNSSSTMHKLASTPITMDCFEMDDYSDVRINEDEDNCIGWTNQMWHDLIYHLELLREKHNELIKQSKKLNEDASEVKDRDKGLYEHLNLEAKKAREQATKYWKELIRLLPESWLQTSVIDLNYETLRNIYAWRKNHKLTEWHQFCKVIEELPLAKELIIGNTNERK